MKRVCQRTANATSKLSTVRKRSYQKHDDQPTNPNYGQKLWTFEAEETKQFPGAMTNPILDKNDGRTQGRKWQLLVAGVAAFLYIWDEIVGL